MATQKKLSMRERVVSELNNGFCKAVNVKFVTDAEHSLISEGFREAVNSYDNDRELVRATPWFDDAYWFFIRIRFIPVGKREALFASVSFFQEAGDQLKQLFRAEWDNYIPSVGYNHPQPHWHFTAQLSDKYSFEDLDNEEEEGIFAELAGNAKSINLEKMHFAMAGHWPSDGILASSLGDEFALSVWLINLFAHVREELIYKEREKEY